MQPFAGPFQDARYMPRPLNRTQQILSHPTPEDGGCARRESGERTSITHRRQRFRHDYSLDGCKGHQGSAHWLNRNAVHLTGEHTASHVPGGMETIPNWRRFSPVSRKWSYCAFAGNSAGRALPGKLTWNLQPWR
jgi:hypothetical protein